MNLEVQPSKVASYLKATCPEHIGTSDEVKVVKFGHGQSNPTYKITTSKSELVLRRKPPGPLLPGAHQVDREYRVMRALGSLGFPVPEVVSLCEDERPVGTAFFLMKFVPGRIFLDPALPELQPAQRREVYLQLAETLAALHSADPAAIGLSNFGKSQGYAARQIRRWTDQYHASLKYSDLEPMPEMVALSTWLADHVPASDATCAPSVVHGDFRLDNVIFAPQQGGGLRPAAVLDWELSSLGHPLSDLAYLCTAYHLPKGLPVLPALPAVLLEGVPPEAELVQAYFARLHQIAAQQGRAPKVTPPSPQDWSFFLGLSLFRIGSILAGVYARAMQGNASSAYAKEFASVKVVQQIAQRALAIIAPSSATAPTSPPSTSSSPFDPSPNVRPILERLRRFVEDRILPVEGTLLDHGRGDQRATVHPLMEALKAQAKAEGLWNLFLPRDSAELIEPVLRGVAQSPEELRLLLGPGLTNLEYAHCAQVMGRCVFASEVFNCSAPDTGNMEVLCRYGTPDQQRQWLLPLLRGDIRSCFAMTEPAVASSDPLNLAGRIERTERNGQRGFLINGRKWWTSGACDPRCKLAIFLGRTADAGPPHKRHSMVLVPLQAPGVRVLRPLLVYGYDDLPHGHAEVDFEDVFVGEGALLLGEGRGFEIAQGRLGPGRLHHCMRLIGNGERALEFMYDRAVSRSVGGGKPIASKDSFQARLAEAKIALDGARLLVLQAAAALDLHGFKGARGQIAAAKVAAPRAALLCLDEAVQVHGGAGVEHPVLALMWAMARTLRIADGPDETHIQTVFKVYRDQLENKGRTGTRESDVGAARPRAKL